MSKFNTVRHGISSLIRVKLNGKTIKEVYYDNVVNPDYTNIECAGAIDLINKEVTTNGTYNASDDNADGYSKVTVNVPSTKYGLGIDNIIGKVDSNGVLQDPEHTTEDIVFNGVKTIQDKLYYRFYNNKALYTGVSFPDLISISGCGYAFYGSNITSVSMPALTTITGGDACSNMFYGCTRLASVSLPLLTTITGGSNSCNNMFSGCTALTTATLTSLTNLSVPGACVGMFTGCVNLESLYFPALTTTSFGSFNNQFQNLLGGTGNIKEHTIHFPSNLEETVQGLGGYPTFGGVSGYVTLAFDLPATE